MILENSLISQSTAMEPKKAYQNIENFERKVEALQRLRITKNATDDIISELAKWLFMATEYNKWAEYRSRKSERMIRETRKIYTFKFILLLIEFSGKTKVKYRSMMQTWSEEDLKLLAKADAISRVDN